VRQHLKAGKLVALATSGKERSPELPDVPTLGESGYPGFEVSYAYFGMLPKGASEPVRTYWQERFREMLADPKLVERLKVFDPRVVTALGASARAWIEQRRGRWNAALAGQKLD
jgi:tripartite-type tricarboxylate transporter receptor subunit TctC